uniref:Uncharacterized protein n=1 Tax=Arion vulgaris TaxID=1028688 RepID=A0A0B7AZS3_9EUPU
MANVFPGINIWEFLWLSGETIALCSESHEFESRVHVHECIFPKTPRVVARAIECMHCAILSTCDMTFLQR